MAMRSDLHPTALTPIASALISLFLCFSAPAAAQQPWESKHQELQDRTDVFFASLSAIHPELLTRVESQNPALLTQISLDPPEPREVGYGLLPEIKEDKPSASVKPRKTIYSLLWLENKILRKQEKADELVVQLSEQSNLEILVEDFEQLLKAFQNIEDHLSYHSYWQRSILNYPAYFKERNRLLPLAQQLSDLVKSDDNPARVMELRREILPSHT